MSATQMQLADFKPVETATSPSLSPRRELYIKARTKARARFWGVHDRDTYECPSCGRGRDEVVGSWHVHHKDRDPLNNELVNLVGVCIRCHRKGHRLDNIMQEMHEWKEQFEKLGESP